MTLFYVISLFFLLILPKDVNGGSVAGLDTACTAGDTCTVPDAVCDATQSKCKLDVGGSCASPNQNNCKTGLTCDNDVCTVTPGTYGGTCTAPSGGTDSCVAGDSNAVCSAETGGTCECTAGYSGSIGTKCAADNTYGGTCSINSNVDSCVANDANAVCSSGTGGKCQCKAGYSGSIGTKCVVTSDTYGGACTTPTGGEDSCVAKDANAVCTGNKCACKPGYSATIGTKCSGVAGLTCSLFLLGLVLLVSKYFQYN